MDNTLESSCQPSPLKMISRNENISHKRSKTPSISCQTLGIDERDTLTNWQAVANLIKATIGTGVLAMPAAVRNGGLLLGTLGTFLIAMVIVHAMTLLVGCAQFLRANYQLKDDDELDFIETVRRAVLYGFPDGRHLLWLPGYTRGCLICALTGLLSVYLIFLAENTKYMVDYFDVPHKPPLIVYQVISFAVLLPLVFIKTLNRLAFFSGFCNILSVLSLGIMLLYCVTNLKPVSHFSLAKNMDTIPLFFGVIAFSFESITIVLNIENKMIDKEAMSGCGGVLNLSMVISVCLYTAVGFYGYLCFGEDIDGSLTYSIPMNPWYVMIAKPMYTLTIYVSYALQVYLLFTILWEFLEPRLNTPRGRFWGAAILRLSLPLISFIMAVVIPHVDLMISLVGALTGSSLTLIIPCALDSIVVWKRNKTERIGYYGLIMIKNALMIMLGVLGATVGTYTSIVSIGNIFRK